MQGLKLGDESGSNSMHSITWWCNSETLEEFREDLGDNYIPVGTDVYDTGRRVLVVTFTQ